MQLVCCDMQCFSCPQPLGRLSLHLFFSGPLWFMHWLECWNGKFLTDVIGSILWESVIVSLQMLNVCVISVLTKVSYHYLFLRWSPVSSDSPSCCRLPVFVIGLGAGLSSRQCVLLARLQHVLTLLNTCCHQSIWSHSSIGKDV